MARASTSDHLETRNSIIRGAMRLAGVLSPGKAPSADEVKDASGDLNTVFKSWQAFDFVWIREVISHTLGNATASYTIGDGGDIDDDRPQKIESIIFRASSLDARLMSMNEDEYWDLENKATAGPPKAWYYDPTDPLGTIYLHPVQATGGSDAIKIIRKRLLLDFDAGINNPDCPPEFFRCLKYQLAVDLAIEYGKGLDLIDRLETTANNLLVLAGASNLVKNHPSTARKRP